MLTSRPFVYGVVAGIGGLWLWHRFVRPVPGKNG